MRKTFPLGAALFVICSNLASPALADRRQAISALGLDLDRQASVLAQESFDHFRGWNNTISEEEQAVLFNSETFLADCRRLLNRIEAEFSRWPSPDNLAYLDQKYVKARNATVYLIERKGTGLFIRHAFKNLESIYRYNYDRNGGKDPWAFLVEVAAATLDKMDEGEMIDLTFEGRLVIEQGSRPNRSVYLIEAGKKRGVTSPRVLERLGGWSKVYEVPAEVIAGYPDGDPIM